MNTSRRDFLLLAGFPVGLLALGAAAQKGTLKGRLPATAADQEERRNPLNAPDAQPADSRALLRERREEIKKQVKQLYGLAGQLKSEIEKTDAADVLSVQVLKQAGQIQKLARQIQSLARG